MQVQPYLYFEGRTEEALNFYKKILDAQITSLMRFSEAPMPTPPEMVPLGSEKKIMHSAFKIGDTTLMASDGHCTGKSNFQGVSLSLTAPTDAEAKRIFSALAEGGQVQMPLAKSFFASSFGMVADRFGVSWMILTAPAQQ